MGESGRDGKEREEEGSRGKEDRKMGNGWEVQGKGRRAREGGSRRGRVRRVRRRGRGKELSHCTYPVNVYSRLYVTDITAWTIIYSPTEDDYELISTKPHDD